METAPPTLTADLLPASPLGLTVGGTPGARWFSGSGCVVTGKEGAEVFVGGTLVGRFGRGEHGARNVILVGLALDPQAHYGRLAEAFDVSSETLRLVRRLYETDGLEAVLARTHGGRQSNVAPKVRRKLEEMFDHGVSVRDAVAKLGSRHPVARSTAGRLRVEWAARRVTGETAAKKPLTEAQVELPGTGDGSPRAVGGDAELHSPLATTGEGSTTPAICEVDAPGVIVTTTEGSAPAVAEVAHVPATSETASGTAVSDQAGVAEEEDKGADVEIAATTPRSGRSVQHLGTWLMVAVAAGFGLHQLAEKVRDGRVERSTLRIALDAVIMALAIGERCVEGVRRLATATGPTLLRAKQAASATWVRRVLGRIAGKAGGARLHLGMAGSYLRAARDAAGAAPVVFYVDNHLRPYTGSRTVRHGWRMQDKRSVPGSSDYYVHDEDGRPVLRLDVPSHSSLTSVLTHIAQLLRLALGPEQKILLAFDRAGAFPEQMAELREEGFEFVTYERKPFPRLSSTAFSQKIEVDAEIVGVRESRTNLGSGRGRVRRIALRLPDGRQINLLAISEQSAEWLAAVMRGRWNQENGFKHGVERWGINQLDGRSTSPYPPDTIIPNPARRRLDRALKIARTREGDARRKLAALPKRDSRRAPLERDQEDAVRQQRELLAQRPSVPTHAPLEDTDLARKLVHHTCDYKFVIDTIRIACANAESDLAGEMAPFLRRPAEAKRVLQNLLTAPGNVHVGTRTITVSLRPAGTRNELQAIDALLAKATGWDLSLPGDPKGRSLRFKLQKS